MHARHAPVVHLVVLVLVLLSTAVHAGAQPGQAPPAPPGPVRQLTMDEAVALALENNLGVRVARIEPLVQDLGILQARTAWAPNISTTVEGTGTDSPNVSVLSGAEGTTITDNRLATTVGLQQALPWGARYSVGWDSSRATTTNLFSNFSPQVRSSVTFSYRQPLLRDRAIDTARWQVTTATRDRSLADLDLRQTVVSTARSVRSAYWNLAYAIALLDVQRQSLELAQESLRNTRARIEIGTQPPIDVVEAEAEVAQREEAVILAEAQIEQEQDTLRTLVFDPSMPDFWTVRIEPAALPAFEPAPVDVDGAVRRAIAERTDVRRSQRAIETDEVGLRFFRNQTLPDVSAGVDFGGTGLGGTQFVRGPGLPGPIIGQTQRSFGSVLGDVFGNAYPTWTASLSVNYPLGTSQQEASLARARLQLTRTRTELQRLELQVTAQVRAAGRQVTTNQRRVDTTRVARELAERRLDAEQRKLAAGTSTSFLVFQAQRDLAVARNNELRAVLDYNQSVVDFEAVQQAPIAGTGTGTGTQTATGAQ
ncbi:MAG: TolC family protein [Acidobacteria bacterium]|nr:TolC family protein [Acidobacteriota bacterium]